MIYIKRILIDLLLLVTPVFILQLLFGELVALSVITIGIMLHSFISIKARNKEVSPIVVVLACIITTMICIVPILLVASVCYNNMVAQAWFVVVMILGILYIKGDIHGRA